MRKPYTDLFDVRAALHCRVRSQEIPNDCSIYRPRCSGRGAIGQDKNSNTKLKMTVQHLANLENLTPRASAYVVWLRERGGNAQSGPTKNG